MIITLRGADFSASNIGTLSSWRITRSLGAGATYEGVTSVDKDAAFNATVTIAEGYELGTAGVTVTMGGTVISAATINGSTITISIASVTGNVVIKVPTVNLSTGEEEEPDVPDTPAGPSTEFIADWTSINATKIEETSMVTDNGCEYSKNGVVYKFTGYDWSKYDARATCRYGTNTSMYAGGFFNGDTFVKGLWKSEGTGQVFTLQELSASDYPTEAFDTIALCASVASTSELQVPVLEIKSKA